MHVRKSKVKSLTFIKLINNIISEKNNNDGFVIPQILVLIIGVSIAITGLIASSVSRLTSSKLSSLELQSKNSTTSGVNNIRSIFNNTKGAYYYFWLAKSCSQNTNNRECPQFGKRKMQRLNWIQNRQLRCEPYLKEIRQMRGG